MKTDEELVDALAGLGNIRGLSLAAAADGPDVLWNRLAAAFGFSRAEADRLRALILLTDEPEP